MEGGGGQLVGQRGVGLERLSLRKLTRDFSCGRVGGREDQLEDMAGNDDEHLVGWVACVQGFGFRIWDFGFRVTDFWFWVSDFWIRVRSFGLRVLGLGFRVSVLDEKKTDYPRKICLGCCLLGR